MKIKFGAFVTDGRGKIGGHVASKNRAGAYLRTKVTPSNPNTSYQAGARALLSSLSTQWGALTEDQRLSWSNAVASFAKTDIFGDIKNPSGINLFIKLNANLANSEQSQLIVAPEKVEVPFAEVTSVVISVALAEVVVNTTTGVLNNVFMRFQSSGPVPQGVSNVKSRMRTVTSKLTIADSANLYNAYVSKFGTPNDTQKVYVSIAPITETGQQGVAQVVLASIVS